MSVTLDDVAHRAGVSPATVSRVLNGTPSRVPISPATRERVWAAARGLGYRPNLTARSLSTRQTRMIGLVLPQGAGTLHHAYHATILGGIGDVLTAQGYGLALYFSEFGHSRRGPNHAALAQDGRVDGGLILDSYALDDAQMAELEREAERFPFVLIGHRLPGSRLYWVAADDRGGAAAVVDHLLKIGHRRVVHLYNRRGHPARERDLGYQEALAGYQIPARLEWQLPAEAVQELGRLWAGDEPPTAVFAWNDYCALAVLRALHESGMAVPRDVSVVGYDDYDVAALALPALTTVRQPLYEMGVSAAEALLRVLDGGVPPVQRVLPTALVVRESTEPPASGAAPCLSG